MFEKNLYQYSGIEMLIQEQEKEQNEIIYSVNIVCFYINNEGKYPFFQFMLYNQLAGFPFLGNIETNLVLPSFIYNKEYCEEEMNTIVVKEVENNLQKYLSMDYNNSNNNNINENAIDIKGYYKNSNIFYAFVDISKIVLDSYFQGKNSEIWFGLLSEIINNEHICNIKISHDTTQFFNYHYSSFLLDDPINKVCYPSPDIIYEGSHFKHVEFRDMFGISKQNDKYGNQYYVNASIEKAFRNGGWSKTLKPETKYGKLITDNSFGRYIYGGINRFAILTDKIVYTTEKDLNLEVQDSEYIDTLFNDYDTIYIKTECEPYLLLKDFCQQIPLSYHKINRISLKETYHPDNTNEYSIL